MKKVFNIEYNIGFFASDDEGVIWHTFEDPECDEWHRVTDDLVDADSFGCDDTGDLAFAAWKAVLALMKARLEE